MTEGRRRFRKDRFFLAPLLTTALPGSQIWGNRNEAYHGTGGTTVRYTPFVKSPGKRPSPLPTDSPRRNRCGIVSTNLLTARETPCASPGEASSAIANSGPAHLRLAR